MSSSERIVVSIDAERLAGANLAVDVDATANAYEATLQRALEAEFAGVQIVFVRASGYVPVNIETQADDETRRAFLLMRAEALAYGVRKAASYVSYT